MAGLDCEAGDDDGAGLETVVACDAVGWEASLAFSSGFGTSPGRD